MRKVLQVIFHRILRYNTNTTVPLLGFKKRSGGESSEKLEQERNRKQAGK